MKQDDFKQADWWKVFKQIGELKCFEIEFNIELVYDKNIDFLNCKRMYERLLFEKRIAVM